VSGLEKLGEGTEFVGVGQAELDDVKTYDRAVRPPPADLPGDDDPTPGQSG